MDYNEEYNYFQSFLQPNERILWHWAPSAGKMYTYGKIPVFFGVVWLVISLVLATASFMSENIIMILFSKFIRVASATTFIFFYCYNSVKANETFAWDISLPLIFFQSFDRQREGSALIDGHLFYLLK